MNAADVLRILRLLEGSAIAVWLDGGWGVDALLGIQSRPHSDVDLVLQISDVPRLRAAMAGVGFTLQRGAPPDSFLLADPSGFEVDVHAVTFDAEGNGIYRTERGEDWTYPAEGFGGRGTVDGVVVKCLSPTTQVRCHANGYVPTDKDVHDMALLQERFGVDLPAALRATR